MRYNPERQEESDLTKITWICFFLCWLIYLCIFNKVAWNFLRGLSAKLFGVCPVTVRTAASLTLYLNQIILKAFLQFHFVKPILLVQITD